MLRRFWYWLQSPYRKFQLLYPPPYTDEEFEADRAERVRRLVEQRLGRSYITEVDVDKMRSEILGDKKVLSIFPPAEKREWRDFKRQVQADVDEIKRRRPSKCLDKGRCN